MNKSGARAYAFWERMRGILERWTWLRVLAHSRCSMDLVAMRILRWSGESVYDRHLECANAHLELGCATALLLSTPTIYAVLRILVYSRCGINTIIMRNIDIYRRLYHLSALSVSYPASSLRIAHFANFIRILAYYLLRIHCVLHSSFTYHADLLGRYPIYCVLR